MVNFKKFPSVGKRPLIMNKESYDFAKIFIKLNAHKNQAVKSQPLTRALIN